MEVWTKEVKKAEKKVIFAIVAANNHYAGFGPATANNFRQMAGLEAVVWEEDEAGHTRSVRATV